MDDGPVMMLQALHKILSGAEGRDKGFTFHYLWWEIGSNIKSLILKCDETLLRSSHVVLIVGRLCALNETKVKVWDSFLTLETLV